MEGRGISSSFCTPPWATNSVANLLWSSSDAKCYEKKLQVKIEITTTLTAERHINRSNIQNIPDFRILNAMTEPTVGAVCDFQGEWGHWLAPSHLPPARPPELPLGSVAPSVHPEARGSQWDRLPSAPCALHNGSRHTEQFLKVLKCVSMPQHAVCYASCLPLACQKVKSFLKSHVSTQNTFFGGGSFQSFLEYFR